MVLGLSTARQLIAQQSMKGDDHPTRNTTIKRQRPNESIKHHLLRFPRIGHYKRLAAVAQTEVGNLHLLGNTAKNNMLFAPVKLQRIASLKPQRASR